MSHPTAFNATNFLSYATQRLSILVNIGTTEIIKRARVLADPSSTSTSYFLFSFFSWLLVHKKKGQWRGEY
jgi:hypothetical protein